MLDDFLGYLRQWKESLDKNEDLTAKDKERMFISRQTYEGLVITANSLVDTSRFVLGSGMEFFLPEHSNLFQEIKTPGN